MRLHSDMELDLKFIDKDSNIIFQVSKHGIITDEFKIPLRFLLNWDKLIYHNFDLLLKDYDNNFKKEKVVIE